MSRDKQFFLFLTLLSLEYIWTRFPLNEMVYFIASSAFSEASAKAFFYRRKTITQLFKAGAEAKWTQLKPICQLMSSSWVKKEQTLSVILYVQRTLSPAYNKIICNVGGF